MANPANRQVTHFSRNNNATGAHIHFYLFLGAGTFKNAYKGLYTGGPRNGEKCVAKEFRFGPVFSDDHFNEEMAVINKAQEIIDKFNNSGIIAGTGKTIRLNTPEIWVNPLNGHRILVEPRIYNYMKFNCNNGWAEPNGYLGNEALQALSHYSYHESGGRFLLCDLQGAETEDGFILSDPAIVSRDQTFGCTDGGVAGMIEFFSGHTCGRFCKKDWRKPLPSAATMVGRGVPVGAGPFGQAWNAPIDPRDTRWVPPYPIYYVPVTTMYNMPGPPPLQHNPMLANPMQNVNQNPLARRGG